MTNRSKGLNLVLEHIADTLGLDPDGVLGVWAYLKDLGLAADREQENEVLNDIAKDSDRLYERLYNV